MAQSRRTCGKHLSHCGLGGEMAVSNRMSPTGFTCSHQLSSPRSRSEPTAHHSSTMDRCYNSLSLPLPAILPGKNRLLWGLNHEESFLICPAALSYRAQPGEDKHKVPSAPHCLCSTSHRPPDFLLGYRTHLLWQESPEDRVAEPRCRAASLESSRND